ncbi:MAG TPA: metallophosphoesterase family protein [Dokdonella sp.]|uniref:metallophosphoesterase family protein n=1 Tax=Dokdonella sp. TaxID=2291710 RepID=UPI0025BDDDEE|nr:metallophosphoesterase family protein [Dokdonella sp.]MBX3693387.1 metallophosphoesterase family protein [Dokdonella sp.]MCW5568934.1 metallophosphoesterase family protein [Dokdonella sp.]HNR92594.1 metallophosphoesterase family protein [Dokdonella sp.]
MRIGLLADLHANREATEACFKALRKAGCERYVFLGDLVGYGADPVWMVDFVREQVAAGALAVLGNHDAAAVAAGSSTMNEQAEAAIAWTAARLDAEQRAFLAALPLQARAGEQLYVHANAWAADGWAYVGNTLAAARSLAATDARLTFCGHVHEPALYFTQAHGASHFAPTPGQPIPLIASRRWLAIPGSCGQPRDHNPAAACAWFDQGSAMLCFLRVPYDHERAAAKIRAAGLPDAFAARLLTGT